MILHGACINFLRPGASQEGTDEVHGYTHTVKGSLYRLRYFVNVGRPLCDSAIFSSRVCHGSQLGGRASGRTSASSSTWEAVVTASGDSDIGNGNKMDRRHA